MGQGVHRQLTEGIDVQEKRPLRADRQVQRTRPAGKPVRGLTKGALRI